MAKRKASCSARNIVLRTPTSRCCNVNHIRDQDTHTHLGQDGVPVGILRTRWTDKRNTWRPWRQCILAEYLRIHLWPNGPSIKCSRSVTTVTYAYRVVGIMREQMTESKKIVGTHSRTVTARVRKCLILV